MSEPTPRLSHIAPVFSVADLTASLAYYRDRLLFEVRFEWADAEGAQARYAILCRDAVELHLSSGAARNQATAYCFVEDVDGYYAKVMKAGANITEALADQPWKMREFETRDPDGNALVFGEHLDRIER